MYLRVRRKIFAQVQFESYILCYWMQKGKTWKEKILTYFTYDMFIGFAKEKYQRFVFSFP